MLSFKEWCERYLSDLLVPEMIERLVDEQKKLDDMAVYGASYEDAAGRRVDPRGIRGVGATSLHADEAAGLVPVSRSVLEERRFALHEWQLPTLYGFPVHLDDTIARDHLEIRSEGPRGERVRVFPANTPWQLPAMPHRGPWRVAFPSFHGGEAATSPEPKDLPR